MTPRITHALLAAGLLAASFSAPSAHADPIRLSALPELVPVRAPLAAKAPKSIPAAERVAGFYVADPRHRLKDDANMRYVSLAVFDDAAAADNFEKALAGEYALFNGDLRNPASNTCFTLSQDAIGPQQSQPAPEWQAAQGTFAQLYGNQPGARAIRAERWLPTPQGAKLETTVLWLDPLSGGLREHSRFTTELTRLASRPDALELIVRRDPARGPEAQLRAAPSPLPKAQPDSFALLRSQLAASRAQAVSQALVMNAQLVQENHQSDCSHMRLGLRVKRQPPKPLFTALQSEAVQATLGAAAISAEQVGINLDAALPEVPAEEAPQPARRDSATITTSVVLGVQRELTTHQASMLGLSAEQQAAQVTGVRARALSIHVGISKLSRDSEPVVSLSYRWDEKARDVSLVPSF